jgi:tellurite resistance protein
VEKYLTSQDDKINYLKGLMRIAKADGNVTDEEKKYYKTVAIGLNVPRVIIDELENTWKDEKDIELCFSDERQALFFIQEAIQISMIDGEYSASEQQEIKKIAIEAGITLEAVSEFEAWVNRGLDWRKEGEQIIDKYNIP